MNGHFKINTIRLALCLAYPALGVPALAAEPFPSMPPALSTSVTPNVLLIVDTSLSMNDNPNGQNTKKIDSAKKVAKQLITDNPTLRWGLFSYDGSLSAAEGATKRADVGSAVASVKTAIDGLSPAGITPLGEALYEAGRYWAGETSYYGKLSTAATTYTSPIQYRCQKNFNIYLTDGESTADNKLPGACQNPSVNVNFNQETCSSTATAGAKISQETYSSFNAAGAQVTRNFGICRSTATTTTNAANPMIVDCPAKLGASTVNNPFFGDSGFNTNTYFRSIRDVAVFLFDKDMKITGTDGDGVSWNDPKFPKQNVVTYTVGFTVDNVILKAAAVDSGGRYQTAANETELSVALNNAVASIINEVSNAGGVATTNPAKADAGTNKMYQPVFNPLGWYGELRCYDYNAITYGPDGSINGGYCSPNAKSVIPAATGRKIWTAATVAATTTVPMSWARFEFLPGTSSATSPANMSARQKTLLGAAAADQNRVVNFVRGVDVVTGTGVTRVRPASSGLMGDITDSQPQVVAAPNGNTSDSSYATFKTTNAARNMVFIGANDGMLHAFGVSDMTELMGFVPSSVYPHLKNLPATDYGAATPHVYGVNGELRQADVKLGTTTPTWKTILVGGLAQGGQGFFAVDATDSASLTTSAATAVKWEWTDLHDNEMGYSFGAPIIYNVRTSATAVVPAVILVNGYENYYDDTDAATVTADRAGGARRTATVANPAGNTSVLYVLNADTGALIKKIPVPGGVGLSSPAGVDFGQDGILDYVYAGDINGKLWRFDLTASDPANFKVLTTPIFDAGATQPITLRPAVKPVVDANGQSRGNLVMFGTGKLLTDADRSTKETQSFYAVLDDMSGTPSTVAVADLVPRTIDTTTPNVPVGSTVGTPAVSQRAGTYRAIAPATTKLDLTSSSETKKGWYMNFPATSERLVSSPILMDYMLLFGTGVPMAAKVCTPGGTGWVMGVDPMTGGVTVSASKKPFSFVDVKADGKSTVDDKLSFSGTTGAAYASGFSTEGIPTELTYLAAESRIVNISSTGGTLGSVGNVIALKDSNLMAVYNGNAASGTSKGDPMGRPAPNSGKGGDLVVCGIGGVKCEKNTINPPPVSGAYKIETSIWREIK